MEEESDHGPEERVHDEIQKVPAKKGERRAFRRLHVGRVCGQRLYSEWEVETSCREA
jgi:hypothetical protein